MDKVTRQCPQTTTFLKRLGGGGGGGREDEGVKARPRIPPEKDRRTMEVLRQCPLAIAQRLVHCAIAVSTAVLGRVTRTMLLKKCTLYS